MTVVAMFGATAAAAPAKAPRWTVQKLAGLPKNSDFPGIACASATRCVAVGDVQTAKAVAPLAYSWNGTTWSRDKIADPLKSNQAGNVSLLGVSCAAPTNCVAVGSYAKGNDGVFNAISEVYNGSKWTVHKTATVVADGTSLNAVSCPTTTSCVAVGSYGSSQSSSGLLSESWNGSKWTLVKTPALFGSFLGVSCLTAGVCTAVGDYSKTGTGNTKALAERLSSGTWQMESTPAVKSSIGVNLDSVSCPTSAYCVAVGTVFLNHGLTAVAEVWAGKSWQITKLAAIPGSKGSLLNGVSCTAANTCRAVGARNADKQGSGTLAQGWNGKAWSLQTSAAPGPSAQFDAVACTKGPNCSAAGNFEPNPTDFLGFVERN